ncbi:MAG: corrinoid protein [Desulfobacterales bacterium]|nr:corrinoid protein [Desulfobacterales bacterium]
MGGIFKEMEQAIIDGDEELCTSLAQRAIDGNMDAAEAIQKGYAEGMRILGDRFESGECFLPELLAAEDAMNAAVEVLKPKIEETGGDKEKRGKVVIGTIQGDVHDIGKNIVKLFMSVAGFEMIDVGRDVPLRTFIQTAQKENADVIAASALMTTTMTYMPEMIKQLKELGIREQFKVMVGGAPVIESWAEEIGSDGYGLTAKEAVQSAMELMIKDSQPKANSGKGEKLNKQYH